ncbi:RagB/SusD family nutrient uptake outer membrane protein [Porphyromonas canoris]|uniref:RagB/SusD family nutrient uptake outer membrane protein n=1 Tax=Porphyromonas canoris TaxID=36875 RepID=UPI00068B5725|nr:RagB/SusD family nutrient uptake outer membrane protein [Porphyromonas canoris]
MKRIVNNIFAGLFLILTGSIMTTSCGDFLRERSNDLAYIRTADDLDELLIGACYMSVAPTTPRRYDNFYFPYLHYMSDETQELIGTTRYNPEANIRPRMFGYYTWQQHIGEAFNGLVSYKESVDWLRVYNHIITLNIVLNEASSIKSTTEAEQNRMNRIKAEAHFLRAAYYFFLVNLYAQPYAPENLDKPGIPLKTAHYIENKKFQRSSIKEVYDHIISDLDEALRMSQGVKQLSLYRISEAGINLFASRVYLYMQDWKKSEFYAQKAMDLHPQLCNLNGLGAEEYFFSSSNPELIFSMGGGLIAAEMSNAPIGGFAVSKDLYALYDKKDLRAQRYMIRSQAKGALDGGHYVQVTKTNPKNFNRSEVSDVFVLRSGEIYLNLAEALAMQGKNNEAVELINKLRKSRYQAGANSEITMSASSELVQAIRQERRMELCFEGQRWFDIRRYRVNSIYPSKEELVNTYTIYKKDGRNSKPNITYYYTLPAEEDEGYVLPLPREQRSINDQIQDNPRLDRKPSKIHNYETK